MGWKKNKRGERERERGFIAVIQGCTEKNCRLLPTHVCDAFSKRCGGGHDGCDLLRCPARMCGIEGKG